MRPVFSTSRQSHSIAFAISTRGGLIAGIFISFLAGSIQAERPFSFKRDTFAFANETVWEYHEGHASLRREKSSERPKRFTQHCFVMSRAIVQFQKFARFDPALPALDDKQLASRIRKITGRAPWRHSLPERKRIIIPGFSDLRTLSRARTGVVERSIGLGWPSNFRPGNWRILFPHGSGQQTRTHAELEQTLARGEFFVAYLTTLPQSLHINHAVLIYERRGLATDRKGAKIFRYSVYDPNHAEAPRKLTWSERDHCFLYERDWDFVGGRLFVWQVYGGLLQ